MATARLVILFIPLLFPFTNSQVSAQDSQEIYEEKLLDACAKNDLASVKSLIAAHRLWVKPVVDTLIAEYIEYTLSDRTSAAKEKKSAIFLLSSTFEHVYGEQCLSIGASHIDTWKNPELIKKVQADRLNRSAKVLRSQMDRLDEAVSAYHEVLTRYKEIEDERGLADAYGGMGYVYWFINSDSCHHYYLKALECRKKVDDKQLTASTLNGLGSLHYRQLYDLDKALAYYSEAASIREDIGDWYGLGTTLSVMANVYEDLNHTEKANETFHYSYEINRKSGNLRRQAESLYHLGANYKDLDRHTEALDYLAQSKDLFEELQDPIGIADVYIQLGLVHINIGNYETAIEEALKAQKLFEESADAWGLGGAYNNIGIILQDAKRPEKALTYYEKALHIYEELEDPDNIRRILNNLGTLNYDMQDYLRSEEYQLQSLQISREMEYKNEEATCLLNLANTQNRLHKYEEAINNYNSALDIARSSTIPEIEWKVLVGIGENYKLQGDYQSAIEYTEAGLVIVEQMRGGLRNESDRSSYMARERYAYEEVIHMLGELHSKEPDQGSDLKAFEYAQRSKSRSFLEQIATSGSEAEHSSGPISAEPMQITDIQNTCLGKKEVFLEFSMGDSCSYLWIITKEKHLMLPIPKRQILKDQIETFRFALLNPSQDNKEFLIQSGINLYENLIKPAESYFPKNCQLIILPDGILNYLPFEVLIHSRQAGPEAPYASLPYLIKNYPISYGQSSSVMKHLIEDRAQQQIFKAIPRIVAFGDPVYVEAEDVSEKTRTGYNRLIYSGEEVARIGAYFGQGNSDIYVREAATEETVKNQLVFKNASHIHFATHGFIDEDEPSRSSLVLSQVNRQRDDGYLRAAEISQLEMEADLVVLSACQSGLGKMIRGEGVIGLSRAFMYAGTPSLIMSLWNVSDKSTSILMDRFYENLIRKRLSKAEALRLAQISMIEDATYAHPFFWAPFVLTGDWK